MREAPMPTRDQPARYRCSCGGIIAIWDDETAGTRCYRHGDGEAVLTVPHPAPGVAPDAAAWVNRVHDYEGIAAPRLPYWPYCSRRDC